MKVLILLYGLWFNPNQIVTLSDITSFSGAGECRINFSRGKYQQGHDVISVEKPCHEVAEEINAASK